MSFNVLRNSEHVLEQKNRKLQRFFGRHMKSRNGVVLGELCIIADELGVEKSHQIYRALERHERMVAEVKDLVRQRNARFTLKAIAAYLEEFCGYVNAEDVFSLFRSAGVSAGEIVRQKGFSYQDIPRKLRLAGYSIKEIALAAEPAILKRNKGGRMLNAHRVFSALVNAGFRLEEIALGLRAAGFKGSEVGIGILMADAMASAREKEGGAKGTGMMLEDVVDDNTVRIVGKTITSVAMYRAEETLAEISEALLQMKKNQLVCVLLGKLKRELESRGSATYVFGVRV